MLLKMSWIWVIHRSNSFCLRRNHSRLVSFDYFNVHALIRLLGFAIKCLIVHNALHNEIEWFNHRLWFCHCCLHTIKYNFNRFNSFCFQSVDFDYVLANIIFYKHFTAEVFLARVKLLWYVYLNKQTNNTQLHRQQQRKRPCRKSYWI